LKASPLPHRSNRAAQAKAAIYKEALDEGDVVPFAEDDLEEIGGEDE